MVACACARPCMHAAVDLCMHLLACRLEKRRSRLQAQVQAMQAVQQRERQTMREFGALAEEHLGAAAAPLRDAQQALAQVYFLLSSSHGCRKRLQWSSGRLAWCQLRLWRLHREHAHASMMRHLPNAEVVCGHRSAVHLLHMHDRRHIGGCKKASNWRRRNLPCKQNSRSWMQLLMSSLSSSRQPDRHWRKCRCTCVLSTLHMPMPAVQAAVIHSCCMMTWRCSFLLLYDLGREQGAAEDG